LLSGRWITFPDNAHLPLGNPMCFGETAMIKNDGSISIPNKKVYPVVKGIRSRLPKPTALLAENFGDDRFAGERGGERWKELEKLASSIEEKVLTEEDFPRAYPQTLAEGQYVK